MTTRGPCTRPSIGHPRFALAWHHLSLSGGHREEIAAAAALLDGAGGQVPARQLAMFDRLREAVDRS
ncbi:MAG: hypothetical protein ACYC0H_15955 [Solirubrobacteraceae bacterium]